MKNQNSGLLSQSLIDVPKKKFLVMINLIGFISLLLLVVALIMPQIFIRSATSNMIFPSTLARETPVAIVFGAGLRRDGTPTDVLRDRISVAADLYFSGQVQLLLMSGDNRTVAYNEPAAMSTYAQNLGVPESAIVLDYAGRRTYDTCYRALHIFGIHEAILVTQNFHLPRALYTCNHLGIVASGVSADLHHYRAINYWIFREALATSVALVDLWITHPLPVLGEPEPIQIINAEVGPIPATDSSEHSNSGGQSGASSSINPGP